MWMGGICGGKRNKPRKCKVTAGSASRDGGRSGGGCGAKSKVYTPEKEC